MDTYLDIAKLTEYEAINFLLALTLCALIAWILDMFIDKVLRRLAGKTKMDLDDKIIDIIHMPIRYGVFFIGSGQALLLLSLDKSINQTIQSVLYTLVLFMLAAALGKLARLLIESYFSKKSDSSGLSQELQPLFKNIARIVLFVSIGIAMLSVWNLDVQPLLASAGIAGIAIAMAAKDTVANFFGGVSIFVDRPYKISDYIVMDNGQRGEVVTIGIRSTRIKTRDDIMISIPNSIIANSKIINQSAPIPPFRVRIPIGVSYQSDIDHVEAVLMDIAQQEELAQDDPEPRVRFRLFGASSLNLELLCWCSEPALRGRLIHNLNKTILKRFNKEGIEIPFPQRDVHLYHTD